MMRSLLIALILSSIFAACSSSAPTPPPPSPWEEVSSGRSPSGGLGEVPPSTTPHEGWLARATRAVSSGGSGPPLGLEWVYVTVGGGVMAVGLWWSMAMTWGRLGALAGVVAAGILSLVAWIPLLGRVFTFLGPPWWWGVINVHFWVGGWALRRLASRGGWWRVLAVVLTVASWVVIGLIG